MGIEELMLDRAAKQGEQKKSREFVKNLLLDFGFTDEQTAKAAQVSIEFVQKIRAELNNKQKG